jgi:benzoate transport
MNSVSATLPRDTAAVPNDPRALLLAAPMSRQQIIAVVITVALCAMDGFDILAITFAAPGIVAAWGIDRAQLGIVFSVGLLGVAAGSLFIGPIADLIGRRAMIVACLILLSVGMFASAYATSVVELTAYRFVTGLGIGAVIATIASLAAEYANARRRDLAVGLMTLGFPIGGVVGGAIVAWLLRHYDWRAIFIFGASLSIVLLPIVWRYLPDPVGFLIEQRGPRALERVNAFLARSGHPGIAELPVAVSKSKPGAARLASIFGRDLIGTTLHMTGIFFLNVIAVFFVLNWIPQIVADLGFPASEAAGVSAIANLAGVAGGALLGWIAPMIGLKRITILAMLAFAGSVTAFGLVPADLGLLRLAAAIAGFCLFASMVGLYSVISRTFPTQVRATGTGFVIGIGRLGSAISPAIAGLLFAGGMGRDGVSMTMASAALLAALLLALFTVRAPTN